MSKIRKNYPAKFKKEVVLAVLRDDTPNIGNYRLVLECMLRLFKGGSERLFALLRQDFQAILTNKSNDSEAHS